MDIRWRAKKLCWRTALCLGLLLFCLTSPTGSGSANREIPVILYHRVGYTAGNLTVTPESFAADLDYLAKQGYQTISLSDLREFLRDKNVELPEKPVLITFDDGYADNYQYAFPILQQHHMTGAFFVISGMLWDHPDRLTPQQVREMAEAGMSFGSHTVSHRALAELAGEELTKELENSKTTLESITGKSVDFIAYPRGSYDERTLAAVRANGYWGGFTTVNGKCSRSSDQLRLKRIPVFSYDRGVAAAMRKRG